MVFDDPLANGKKGWEPPLPTERKLTKRCPACMRDLEYDAFVPLTRNVTLTNARGLMPRCRECEKEGGRLTSDSAPLSESLLRAMRKSKKGGDDVSEHQREAESIH